VLAAIARFPHTEVGIGWAIALSAAMIVLLASCGVALWRTTQFR
jgi:hypothetical protein